MKLRTLVPFVLALLHGCHPADERPEFDLDVSVERDAEQPTKLWVSWSDPGEGPSWVEYAPAGEPLRLTPTLEHDAEEHRVPLLGLPGAVEVELRVVTSIDGVEHEQRLTSSTDPMEPEVPTLPLLRSDPEAVNPDSFLLLAFDDEEGFWTLIVDREARVVWRERGLGRQSVGTTIDRATGELVQVSRSPTNGGRGRVSRRSLLAGPASSVDIGPLHHDFQLLPQGGIAWIEATTREVVLPSDDELSTVVGDRVMVMDDEGEISLLFDTFGWSAPYDASLWDGDSIYGDAVDWTHANALDYREDKGTLLLSVRNLAVLLELDAEKGELREVYGNPEAGWSFAEGTEPFWYQHDAQWTGDGHLLMLSTPAGQDGGLEHNTALVEYALDPADGSLRECWSYGRDQPLYASSGGTVQRLPSGNTLAQWGHDSRVIREIDADGVVVWESSFPDPSAPKSAIALEDLYVR